METADILTEALKLDPADRLEIAERILQTLDEPDERIERLWREEAVRRLADYRAGRVRGIPAEDVLGPF